MKNWITKRLAFLDQSWPYDFTGDNDQFVSNSFSIFPNPFTDQLNIQIAHSINGDGFAELFSAGGMLIRKNSFAIKNGQISLDFSGVNSVSPGLYVLRIIKNKQIIFTEKIMKKP